MSLPLRHSLDNLDSLDRILEDLLVRFVLNVPPEDLSSVERELFHFEEALWFYTDFIKLMNPSLPSLKIKSFATNIIRICPIVWKWDIKADEALQKFSLYKRSIPVRGAAIFNEKMNKILLVQGTESDSWSFPRGKISKDEDDVQCCIREVKEEIGFDLTDYIDEDQFIERNISGKNYKIFLVPNVPESTEFKPQVRNEIDKIEWKDFKKITRSIYKQSGSTKYYLINSMIRPLSIWCKRQKPGKDDADLIKHVEQQLKSLLGISTPSGIVGSQELANSEKLKTELSDLSISDTQTANIIDIDPGRALLNSLQSAFQTNQQTNFVPPPLPMLMNNNGSNNNMFPAMMNNSFQPFAPFPIVNNNNGVLPFMNNNFAPVPVAVKNSYPVVNHPVDMMNVPSTPNVTSLSKPSLINPSNGDNAKQLLNILNKKTESTKNDPNKPMVPKLLKRGESLPLSNNSSSTANDSKKLLNLLKKPTQEDHEPHTLNTSEGSHIEGNNDGYEEFESSSEEENEDFDQSDNITVDASKYPLVINDEQYENDEQYKLKKLDDNDLQSNEGINPDVVASNSFSFQNGDIPHVEETTESNKGNAAHSIAYQSVDATAKPKVKLLKRGEQLSNNMLSPPKVSPESIPYTNNSKTDDLLTSSKDLLNMLNGPVSNNRESNSPSSNIQSPANPLLSLLKNYPPKEISPNSSSSNIVPNTINPVNLSNHVAAKVDNQGQFRNDSVSPQSHAQEFLNVLNNKSSSSQNFYSKSQTTAMSSSTIQSHNSSHFLNNSGSIPMNLNAHDQFNNMQFSQFSHSPMNLPQQLNQDSFTNQQQHQGQFMEAFGNRHQQSPMGLPPPQLYTPPGMNPQPNELLNMLKGPANMGNFGHSVDTSYANDMQNQPQTNQTASNQLFNLLHKK